MNNALFALLPSVDKLSRLSAIQDLHKRYPRKLVVHEIRTYLVELREGIKADKITEEELALDALIAALRQRLKEKLQNSLRRGINGAGIILHTGMGRAPLSVRAQEALMDVVANYSTLQVDMDTGKRGNRDVHIESLLQQITGAEAATVVNNNAAATMLVLNTIAQDREVIVSRGELVEIGGAFRIPDVMEQSGALLREVGTTNRTHLKDYKGAIDEELTGAILHVHKSNYYISGFTKEVPIAELAELAHANELPLYDDLGSGALIDLERYGLPHEPTVQESLADGADIVSFSGDKLLGGPQAGIIVGKKEWIDRIRKNQLSRALRCDKMTYAVLEATLRLFLDEEKLLSEHPVMHQLTEPLEEVKKRAQSLQRRLKSEQKEKVTLRLIDDTTEVGSGSLSWGNVPTVCVAIQSDLFSPDEIGSRLRKANPPVLGRIKNDSFLLDARTILHNEIGFVLRAFRTVFSNGEEDLSEQ